MTAWWLAALSLASLAGFVLLGGLVRGATTLWAIDRASMRMRGRGISLARALTKTGRTVPLAIAGALLLVAFYAMHVSLWCGAAVIATQLVSQGAVEAVKRQLRRARPREWVAYEELGFSFPSGHATTAVVFYGTSAVLVALAPVSLAVRVVVSGLLVAWAVGIDWSRMVLGAHYATDVLGGTLFGLIWSFALLALLVSSSVAM